jgi:hypothetical protein
MQQSETTIDPIKTVRTITEILKDADATNDLQTLINLWNEIANDKRQYPLTQIDFAINHIAELTIKSNSSDIDKGKFYMALKTMLNNDFINDAPLTC